MNDPLNIYGDQRLILNAGFGADIASQRADDLDQMALDRIWLLNQSDASRSIKALDLACGLGGQAVRMAAAGAQVVAADIVDYENEIMAAATNAGIKNKIQFLRADMRDLDSNSLESRFHQPLLIVLQRALHYLCFRDAIKALNNIRHLMAHDGKLYVSVSGIGSELGNGYGHANNPLETRYSMLASNMSEKHGIRSEVCLYSQVEFASLLELGGFRVEKIFTSPFGNHKAVAIK